MSTLTRRRVVALVRLTDTDDHGRNYIHAEPGDLGTVVDHFEGCLPTVKWDQTGTSCDVAPDEVQILTRPVIARS